MSRLTKYLSDQERAAFFKSIKTTVIKNKAGLARKVLKLDKQSVYSANRVKRVPKEWKERAEMFLENEANKERLERAREGLK